ncbi:hypothetical protein ACEWY4_009901 [Coilia grayii]|uniref:Uncharacterized protein n=1 Tax=Coilia grayii TaxID=363190 RepID=A0ABD1K7R5_9TELE
MKLLLLSVCTLLILSVNGQDEKPPDPNCDGIEDYRPCKDTVGISCTENSICFCKDKKPYCRCNNFVDEWFIGDNCEQKWTTATFALVASLPGIGLAILVGIIVYFAVTFLKGKKNKASKANKKAAKNQQEAEMFKNMNFASDMQERPNSNPLRHSMRPPNQPVPMTGVPENNYRMPPPQDRAAPSRPFSQPYSPPRNMHPSQDGLMAGPPMQSNRNMHPPLDGPMSGPPMQPNSYGSGMGQVLNNPYGGPSTRRPQYEGPGPSPDYGQRTRGPPTNGVKVMSSQFPPAPTYSAPDYPPSSPFQRPMMDGRY